MNKEELEKLIEKGLNATEIGDELGYSQTNVRYWLRKYGLNTKYFPSKDIKCPCGAALRGNQLKFCSKKCKSQAYTTNPNSYISQKERGRVRKLQLIQLKGGCCEVCGYNTNYTALVFHHKNPSNKLFNIDSRRCGNTNLSCLVQEVNKCSLLCQNCHAELHHPDCVLEILNGNIFAKDDYGTLSVSPQEEKNECLCGAEISRKAHRCLSCSKLNRQENAEAKRLIRLHKSKIARQAAGMKRRKVDRPSKDELLEMIWNTPVMHLARQWTISDCAVKKWAKKYQIPVPPRGYWSKFQQGHTKECEEIKTLLFAQYGIEMVRSSGTAPES